MGSEFDGAMGRRGAIGVLMAAALVPFGHAMAAEAQLSGSVFYRERMLLPPDAVLTVVLADVSLADAPARVVAEKQVPATSSPTAFTLAYDPSAIERGHRYVLQARIMEGARLLFINTTSHPVELGGQEKTDILVKRVTAQADIAASPAGKWLAEDIGGKGVIDRLQSVLEIDDTGAVSGNGGCNGIGGQVKIEGSAISFGPMMSTNMACSPAIMNQERKFLDALDLTRAFRVDTAQRKLFLLDEQGGVTVQFSAL